MGDVSLNGWPVLDDGDPRLATGTVPGTKRRITCNVVALPLFLHFYAAWHKEMPARLKLDKGPLDSWEVRQARAGSGFSNHASATACDARYDVLLADNERHMTVEEQDILRRILARYVTADGHQVLGNGYLWRKVDEMHTELSQGWQKGAKRNTTADDVREVIKRLGIKPDGTSSLISRIIGKLPIPPRKPAVTKGPVWASRFLTDQGLTGSKHRLAWTISGRESSWDPSMVYPAGSHDWEAEQPPFDVGWFQINSTHLPEIKAKFGPSATMRAMLDPLNCYQFAAKLSNNWTDLTAWGIGGVNADGSVRFDWSAYPQAWLDKVIAPGVTQRQESEANFLRIWKQYTSGPVAPKPLPKPKPQPSVSLAALLRHEPAAVKAVQAALNTVLGAGLTVDGLFGPRTQSAYDRFRRDQMGLSGTAAAGKPGVQSLTALGNRAGFRVIR